MKIETKYLTIGLSIGVSIGILYTIFVFYYFPSAFPSNNTYAFDLCEINNDLVDIVNTQSDLLEDCMNLSLQEVSKLNCELFK